MSKSREAVLLWLHLMWKELVSVVKNIKNFKCCDGCYKPTKTSRWVTVLNCLYFCKITNCLGLSFARCLSFSLVMQQKYEHDITFIKEILLKELYQLKEVMLGNKLWRCLTKFLYQAFRSANGQCVIISKLLLTTSSCEECAMFWTGRERTQKLINNRREKVDLDICKASEMWKRSRDSLWHTKVWNSGPETLRYFREKSEQDNVKKQIILFQKQQETLV